MQRSNVSLAVWDRRLGHMEYLAFGSLRLDARELDHLGPFLGFFGHVLSELACTSESQILTLRAPNERIFGVHDDVAQFPCSSNINLPC
jgi:hypothetical protein